MTDPAPVRASGRPFRSKKDLLILALLILPAASGAADTQKFGRDTPRGTEYSYGITAHFDGSTGTGIRVEGRSCTFQFE
jgi:hypothetical protein